MLNSSLYLLILESIHPPFSLIYLWVKVGLFLFSPNVNREIP